MKVFLQHRYTQKWNYGLKHMHILKFYGYFQIALRKDPTNLTLESTAWERVCVLLPGTDTKLLAAWGHACLSTSILTWSRSDGNDLVIGLQAAPESPHLCVSATLVPTPNMGDTQKAFVLIRMTFWLMF